MAWLIISDYEFPIFESIPPLFYHGQQQQKWWGVNIFIKGGWLSPDCDAQQFTTYTVSKEKSRNSIVEGNGPDQTEQFINVFLRVEPTLEQVGGWRASEWEF